MELLLATNVNKTRNEELLKKYDLKPNDAILAEAKHMGLYEDLLKTDAKLIPGGAAQNTARGAAVSTIHTTFRSCWYRKY